MQNGTAGVFSSMNYSNEYNNNSKCLWHINVPQGKVTCHILILLKAMYGKSLS